MIHFTGPVPVSLFCVKESNKMFLLSVKVGGKVSPQAVVSRRMERPAK